MTIYFASIITGGLSFQANETGFSDLVQSRGFNVNMVPFSRARDIDLRSAICGRGLSSDLCYDPAVL